MVVVPYTHIYTNRKLIWRRIILLLALTAGFVTIDLFIFYRAIISRQADTSWSAVNRLYNTEQVVINQS